METFKTARHSCVVRCMSSSSAPGVPAVPSARNAVSPARWPLPPRSSGFEGAESAFTWQKELAVEVLALRLGSGAHLCTEEPSSVLPIEVLRHLSWNGCLERFLECFPLKHSKLCVALTCPGSQRCQDAVSAGEGTQLRDLWDVWQSCMGEECLCSTTESWCWSEQLSDRLSYTFPFSWDLEVRAIERTRLFTCVLQPARRMYAFWPETLCGYQCLLFVTIACYCYLTENSRQDRKKPTACLFI